jgi:preprotein translocase subunit SecG
MTFLLCTLFLFFLLMLCLFWKENRGGRDH